MDKEAKKIVLSGGPSSGKSSIINELEKRGYNVIYEVARQVITERQKYSLNKSEQKIRQTKMYHLQIALEANVSGLTFLDRGILDIEAYSKHLVGYTFLDTSNTNYDVVIIPDRLPFVDDGLRVESGEKEAEEIHQKLIRAYLNQGYPVILLPTISKGTIKEQIVKRTDILLKSLEGIL